MDKKKTPKIDLAIMGGTGLEKMGTLEDVQHQRVDTPYGEPSADITIAYCGGKRIGFLPRHGSEHTIAPHRVNYRANVWALHQLGATRLLAISAVGGISRAMAPGTLVLPDQLLDYTYGREHTFFEDDNEEVIHIDFTDPYDRAFRQMILDAASGCGLPLHSRGVLGVMQGPRLETAAEVEKLARDGCDIVNMTGLPEAALARELNMKMANIAIVVNWAAGRSAELITIDRIKQISNSKGADIEKIILRVINKMAD